MCIAISKSLSRVERENMNRNRAARNFSLELARSPEYIRTPGGFRHKSYVHQLDPRQSVVKRSSSLCVRDASRGVFEVRTPQAQVPNSAGEGGGWIAWADWLNPSASMITYFSTIWTVPAAPSTQSGQLIYLFNALEDGQGSDILQPVLQWGVSGAGGGNYWAVASWYVDSSNHAFCTPAIQVNVGDHLTGLITLAVQGDGSLNYTSQFLGIAGTNLIAQGLSHLVQATETLEAYSVTQKRDYPNAAQTAMTHIDLRIASNPAVLNWIPDVMTNPAYGEHSVVVSNASPGGEVDIYY